MVNGLHLYSAFIQSAVQFMPLIHPFTHQRRLAAMQGTNRHVRSNWGLGVLLKDTSTRPGWDRTGNPPTARQQLYLLSHTAHRLHSSYWILILAHGVMQSLNVLLSSSLIEAFGQFCSNFNLSMKKLTSQFNSLYPKQSIMTILKCDKNVG